MKATAANLLHFCFSVVMMAGLIALASAPSAAALDDAEDIGTSETDSTVGSDGSEEPAPEPDETGIGNAITLEDNGFLHVDLAASEAVVEGGVLEPGANANQPDNSRGSDLGGQAQEESSEPAAVAVADADAEQPQECVAAGPGSLSILEDAQQEADRLAAEEAALLAAAKEADPLKSDSRANIDDRESKTSLRATTERTLKRPIRMQQVALQDFDQDQVNTLWDAIVTVEEAIQEALDDALNGATSDDDELPECAAFACFTERIEDLRFGHLSGEPDGAFHEYITTVIDATGFAGIAGGGTGGTINLDATTDLLTGDGLGPRPSYDAIPQFNYCRSTGTDLIEVLQDSYLPQFSWGTSIGREFDIDSARQRNLEKIRTRLRGKPPHIETIPPTERGFTYVNLPMWLWLIDPTTSARTEAISAEQTVRLATRATLLDVTWTIGDTTITCKPEDMREFIHGTNTITEPTPHCHHQFDSVQTYTMTATTRYYIEEQQTFRGYRDNTWPDAPWQPHPDPNAQYVTVTSTIGPFEVHEILSLNISPDITNEQAAAHHRNSQNNTASLETFNNNAEKLLSDN